MPTPTNGIGKECDLLSVATGIDQGSLFTQYLELLPVGAYACDWEGIIRNFNSRAVKLWRGTAPVEDLAARYCGAFERYSLSGDAIAASACPMAEAIRTGRSCNDKVVTLKRADGSRVVVRYDVVVFSEDPQGQVAALALFADISDAHGAARRRTLIEKALRRQVAALELADRNKDAFLATLAHELRNPLSGVVNVAAMLRQPPLSNHVPTELAAMLERQAAQIAQLAEGLLDVAHIQQASMRLSRERFNIVDLVRRTIEGQRIALSANGLTVEVSAPPSAVWVFADYSRLQQVFGNLLHNANKFTGPGGHLTFRIGWDREGFAEISLADNGQGIATEKLVQIFERFKAVDSNPDKRQGLGLGLPLVRDIVALHGGNVRAESLGAGFGSVFTVRVPVASQPDEDPPVGSTSALPHLADGR